MQNDDIMVSVCCLVYNHEKYLRQCLDGIMMQKTNFKFEVLIHDDASTDHSAEIIREYEEKYPDIIKPIYQTENQYSQGVKINWIYQYPRVQGKYIAFCEGDDFWTDETKLQRQYDELESCQNAKFCAHRVRIVNEDGSRTDDSYPHIRFPAEMDADEWTERLLSPEYYQFQTSCYFFASNIIKKRIDAIPAFIQKAAVGDYPLMLLCATEGNIRFIDCEMSCYRQESIGSWSQRKKNNPKTAQKYFYSMIECYKEYNAFTHYRYTNAIKERIIRNEFYYLANFKDYKTLFNKKYRLVMREQPFKTRLYLLAGFLSPAIITRFQLLKGKHKHE